MQKGARIITFLTCHVMRVQPPLLPIRATLASLSPPRLPSHFTSFPAAMLLTLAPSCLCTGWVWTESTLLQHQSGCPTNALHYVHHTMNSAVLMTERACGQLSVGLIGVSAQATKNQPFVALAATVLRFLAKPS